MLIFDKILVFSRYKYTFDSINFDYNFFFNKIYKLQEGYMLQFYKSLSAIFRYNKAYVYFINLIIDAYLYNTAILSKYVYSSSHKSIYGIPKYMRPANAITLFLKNFNMYYNILYSMLYVIYFNLILKRNTAFLQCVAGNNDVIFTTTSTQFGFKKYKRYARFIVEFFLLLSFSYVLDFGLHHIAFKLKLLNYFKYTHIIRKFIYGVKSFRFRFYCKDTSAELKRYYRFLELEKYSEFKYENRYLFFAVHNNFDNLKLKFNLILKSQAYNLLSEACCVSWFTMLYFQYAMDVPDVVSIASIKYFFRPYYIMLNVHGFGAFIYDFEKYMAKLYFIVKSFFFNFFFNKNVISVLLLFYNRVFRFKGLYTYQKRFLTKLSSCIIEYSHNHYNFNILKHVTILYFLLFIKLQKKLHNAAFNHSLVYRIIRFLYIIFKSIYLFFYNNINFYFSKHICLHTAYKHNLQFNLGKSTYFYKKFCEKYRNKNLVLRFYNLYKYYFLHPRFLILHRFKNLQYLQNSFKGFWRSFYQPYFKHIAYVKSSYAKFLNSGDGLDIPYVIIKQVLPYGGGCKLSKIRRKKIRTYKKQNRYIGNFL